MFIRIGGFQLAPHVFGEIADFVLHRLLTDALALCTFDQSANQFGHILRRTRNAIWLRGMNAVFNPEVDVLTSLADHIRRALPSLRLPCGPRSEHMVCVSTK